MDTGRYIFWNRASEKIYERSAKDVIGRTDVEIFPAAMAAKIKKEDMDALTSRGEIKNQIAYERTLQNPEDITPTWQSVDLAFAKAIRMLPEQNVDTPSDTGDIEIFADPLLPRIFFSILSRSFRQGGAAISKIRLTAHRSGESLILVYEDDSTGVPADEKERIFEFGYGHETIVSLFLIRELLSFTGITITETGEPGRGVRFEIVVPKGRFRPSD
jgi:signal transduction histidine kinase